MRGGAYVFVRLVKNVVRRTNKKARNCLFADAIPFRHTFTPDQDEVRCRSFSLCELGYCFQPEFPCFRRTHDLFDATHG